MRKRINIVQIIGIFLIFCGLLGMVTMKAGEKKKAEEAIAVAEKLAEMLAFRTVGSALETEDPRMPVCQIEGEDFIALLEVPAFSVKLPVHSEWRPGRLSSYPCRFWGSAYDSTMVVGGRDTKGQLDFLTKLDLDDEIRLVDMTGAEYIYHVHRVDRSKHAEFEKLYDPEYSLTLYARDTYNMEYVIVRCGQ